MMRIFYGRTKHSHRMRFTDGCAYWTIDSIRKELTALQDTASFQKPDFYRAFTRRIKELFSDFKVLKGDDTIRTVEIIYSKPRTRNR